MPSFRFAYARPPAAVLASIGVALCALQAVAVAGAESLEEKISFNRDVRPILSENCFQCHGPDEKHRDGDRRLDLRESALAENEGIRAIVPGNPDESDLITRVLSHDKDERMPPPKAKKPPLTAAQIATLKRWIAQGAEYEGHWAFLPLSTEEPPPVKDTAWARNSIDQFILAKLEKEGIQPSSEADRATLIRRVALDLIGLLPTREEVREFVEDTRPDAYDELVEKLLNSPHYGERWGRHWLDQARYADSNGYSIDSARAMWPYRDWVIKAINDDMPFDRFTIEQLAGDLLPNPTKSQIIATAFHRNTLINEEGGTKPEQFRFEAVVDRVNTTGAVWLGLTVGCAQCHTHKFDPIPHREYYEMLAFFNQGEEVNNKGATVSVARGEIFGQPVILEAAPEKSVLRQTQAEWERGVLARLESRTKEAVPWSPAKYLEFDTTSNASFRPLEDNSLLSDGRGSFNDTYRIVSKTALPKIAAVRLRVLTHESLPRGGPGAATNGNFVLTDFEASVDGTDQPFVAASADHEQPRFPASAAIDDDAKSGWAINVAKGSAARMNADHEAIFVFATPIAIADRPIEIRLHHGLNQNYLIGRFALDFAEVAPVTKNGAEEELLVALKTPADARFPAQTKLLEQKYESETRALTARKPKKEDPNGDVVELMVMKDMEKARPTFIQLRGDYLRPDEKTGPLSPAVLRAVQPALPGTAKPTRLDLARWLVHPDNPLTPRVTMNRIWMRYFGRGIVETEEDFGTQGAAPTHPELLDWLAREFIRQGWSMKAMHRLITTSATYRQTSKARPELAEKDPRNLWLARQERLRVEAEIVRDAALSASGLLTPAIGGPSVHPPQPDGVYDFTQTNKKWNVEDGPNRFRRALYTMFYRSSPYPIFTTFDAPDFQNVCTRRARSNTPLQALTVANDRAFVELAQGLAARVIREIPSDDIPARLQRAFHLCLSREPSPRETDLLQRYYTRQIEAFATNAPAAQSLGATGPTSPAPSAPPEQAAALVSVARLLFNSDNFITRE